MAIAVTALQVSGAMPVRENVVKEARRMRATGTISLGDALMQASRVFEKGDLIHAAGLYDKVLESVPLQPQALTMRASIAYRQGEDALGDDLIDRAIEALKLALDAMPPEAPEQAGLANLLLARGRGDEAARLLRHVELPVRPMRANTADFTARCERARAKGAPSILMTTMPKSASESLWNILAAGLDFGQCHMTIGLFPHCCLVSSRLRELAKGGIVAKEHVLPIEANLAMIADAGIDKVLVHLRDPRQAVLSWAHFVKNDVGMCMLAPIWRQIVPPAAVLNGELNDVIDWCIDHYLPLLVDFAERWRQLAVSDATEMTIHCMTFERFVADRSAYLGKLLDIYDLAAFNEAAIEQASTIYWRRGRVDEWRDVLSTDQRRRASEALPAALGGHFGWAP